MAEWRTEIVEDCLVRLPCHTVPGLQTLNYHASGLYPIVDQGRTKIAGWTDDETGLLSKDLPVILFGDHTRVFKYVDFPFVRGADGTQILKPKAGIDPLYFFYACRAIDLPSRGYNRHYKILKEKDIQIPPGEQQQDIAMVLQLVENARALQDAEVRASENAKRAATQRLFTQGVRGAEQKDTGIGLVPATWDVVDFASVRERLQYGTSTLCTHEATDFPVLRIPNIEPGRVNPQSMKFGVLSAAEADRYRLDNGDLIFVRTNGVIDRLGACAVYAGEPAGALFASYLIRARLKLDLINPYFASYFFASELGTSIVAGRATPAADGKYNLNTATIDSLPIPLPPTIEEQDEIVAILSAFDANIDLHHRSRVALDHLFQALLKKLVTGEIRVADLDLSALVTKQVAEASS